MLCRLRSSTTKFSKAQMATLVATEEYPIKASVTPKPSAPVVIKSNKLASGIQSVSRESSSPFVALKVAVVGGSSAEGKNAKGAAHFLSKAAFAGSGSHSGLSLVHALESLGANIHAYADKGKIVYDVKVLADKAEPVLEQVFHAIHSPPSAAHVLGELRSSVQLDYNRYAADASAQIRELVQEAAFGDGSAYGSSAMSHNLKKLSLEEVLQYRKAQFVAGNVVVVSSGGVSQSNLEGAINKHAKLLPAGQGSAPAAPKFVGGEVKVRTDLEGNSRLAVAFPVPAGDAGKAYIVLNKLLENELSKQKLCAATFVQSYSQGGLFGVEAATAQHIETYITALKNIASNSPEIDTVKQKLTLDYFLSLEGGCSTTQLLDAHLRGQNVQTAGDYRKVTADEVRNAAAAALKTTPAYAVLGATAGTPSLAAISKML